jgi:DNA modification methylase
MERNSFMDATASKDERFEALKQLYPELVRDGKLNTEALKDLFDAESYDEGDVGYNLYWPGKRNAKKLARKAAEGTLEPVPGDGVNEDKTNNIYIEGDNLEVLRCLKKSYGGRVKMIYIDPPYNTGKDFIYPDNFAEPVEDYLKFTGQVDEKGVSLVANPKSSGAYHRKWLDMMLPRLQLARELLKKDGVIFISIDDNEQANLKLLCDEVFGEENFIECLKWKRKKQPSFLAKHTAKMMEYILVYAKNELLLEKLSIDGTSDSTKKVINISNGICIRHFNKGVRVKLDGAGVIKKGIYRIKTMDVEYLSDVEYSNGVTLNEVDVRSRFSESQTNIDNYIQNKLLFITSKYGLRRDVSEAEKGKRKSITDLLLAEWGDNQESDKEQNELFENNFFDYAKPVSLIKNLIKSNYTQNEIILDFFSGSSTTAHAAMQMSSEDEEFRKFIMVQLPVEFDEKNEKEKNAIGFLDSIHKPHTICEIGKERIRRAGKKILEEHPELKDKLDVGFKVYRLAKSNIAAYKPTIGSDQLALDLAIGSMEKQVTPLRDGFDMNNPNDVQGLLVEIILRQGFALDSKIEKITSLAGNTIYRIVDEGRPIVLHVCLDEKIKTETVKNITFEENDKFICLNSAIDDELYAQLSDKGRVETI